MLTENSWEWFSDDLCRRNGVVLIPYVLMDTDWTVPTNALVYAWEELISDGTAEAVFGGTRVRDAGSFVEHCQSRSHIVAVYVDLTGQGLGITWLSHCERNTARYHIATLKRAWRHQTPTIAMMGARYYFAFPGVDGAPLFDVLIGTIAASNRRAVAFARRMGCTVVGEIPHAACGEPMIITYMTRDQANG